ncbi:spondin-2-like [Aphis craccivora]|uniref:Spondin-2-like n=1 Tax=Aphis craccivora TaxID=307492 RepID=A0A6G0Y696_APHCR|nr:spondin-2-like [Aphis craccivora]
MQFVRRLLACTFIAIAVCRCIGAPSCSPDKLARYRVVVRTFWTRDRFPKHFPEWRPQAQWSKVVDTSSVIALKCITSRNNAPISTLVVVSDVKVNILGALYRSKFKFLRNCRKHEHLQTTEFFKLSENFVLKCQ